MEHSTGEITTRASINEFGRGISQAMRDMSPDEEESPCSDARITSQLKFMDDQLTKVHSLLSDLTGVLDPILLPELSESEMKNVPMPPSKPTSQISEQIDQYNGYILGAQRRIQKLLDRVQL